VQRLRKGLLLGFLAGVFAIPSGAEDVSKQELRSLDDQVQEIKSDVLGIAADLTRLEEKLLYPSNTQIAIFVSIPQGQKFRLDAMRINIDGQLATHYIYSLRSSMRSSAAACSACTPATSRPVRTRSWLPSTARRTPTGNSIAPTPSRSAKA